MKWMIASDFHGSGFYTQKLFDCFAKEQCDRLLILGDILYHGPRNDLPKGYAPKEVIQMVNAHAEQIVCVQGNCDCEVDQMVLELPILNAAMLFDCGNHILYACHGHKAMPKLQKGDVYLQGHTHVPQAEWIDGILHLNPGSIALPKENSWYGYMLWEKECFVWKDFEGNIKETLQLGVD